VCGVEAADVTSILGPIVKSRGLEKLVPQRSLEGDVKQALRVSISPALFYSILKMAASYRKIGLPSSCL
jgi:hypothetical protein